MNKYVIAINLVSIFILSSCSQDKSNDTPAKALSASQQQLQSARYKSDIEKKALSLFISGTEFCEKYKSVTAIENGFSVNVPVDYSDLSKGTTRIWAYFSSGPFDSEKPTMIYFDGGSGGNSHGQKQILTNYNELHYDQRGIGCSHPETLELYRDPNFYSNLNNAKDANEIRKHLKIDQLSLYGASYGTVVATIYASVFEKNTKAVILDGTVYSDESNSKIIGFYLKRMFESLSDGTKAGLKKYINSEDKIARVYMLARMLMYGNDPFGKMKKYLTLAFPGADQINQGIADKILGPNLFQESFFGDRIDSVEGFNNQMLTCKNSHQKQKMDIPLFGPLAGQYDVFTNLKYDVDRTSECEAISTAEDTKVYSADQYPIHAPVVYFQGNLDGATFASGAIQHYKNVPTKEKQLLIAVKGGHCPGMVLLQTKNNDVIEIFESALSGKLITPAQINYMNAVETEVHWVYTNK